MVRDAEFGRRYADKLAEVYTLDGAETWVLAQLQALTHRSGSARKFAKLRLIRFSARMRGSDQANPLNP